MEVIQLRVLARKLPCGSLMALLTGKAANTHGSMNKPYASSCDPDYHLHVLFLSTAGLLLGFGSLVLYLKFLPCPLKHAHSLINQI